MKRVNEIKGFENVENFYFVTTCGKVFSNKKNLKEIGFLEKGKGTIRVFLETYERDKRITIDLHNLVAAAYIPEDALLKYIEHKNGIKSDNYIGNLKWSCKKRRKVKNKKHDNMALLLARKEELTKMLMKIEEKIQDRLNVLLRRNI